MINNDNLKKFIQYKLQITNDNIHVNISNTQSVRSTNDTNSLLNIAYTIIDYNAWFPITESYNKVYNTSEIEEWIKQNAREDKLNTILK